MVSNKDLKLAQIIWNYMNISFPNPPISDVILCLGSIDTLPVETSVDLYKKRKAPLILFSGKGGRNSFFLSAKESDAKMLATIAIKKGVPSQAILIEEKSKNTGQNFICSQELLKKKGIRIKRMIVTHMPSSLRRDFLIFKKQWSFPQPEVFMLAPSILLEEYHEKGFSGKFTQKEVIEDMLGDLQRIKVGFDKGHSVKEEIPKEIKDTYHYLVKKGYTKQLVKDKKGIPLSIDEFATR